MNQKNIDAALLKSPIIIIDGLRSYEEYQHLVENYKDVQIVLINIWARMEIRSARIRSRTHRKRFYGRDRDYNEVMGANMGPTLALADFLVINESSIEEFQFKLENIYRELYFG